MHQPPRILVVDDIEANLEIVQIRLEANGYEVVTAVDGEDALEKAFRCDPDLILLDVMMPKLDGIGVVKRLKADTHLRFVPVILLTAKADTKDIVEGLEAGGDDYLTKPFEQAALVARVRSMLRIKSLHDTINAQAATLQAQAHELADWNRTLEARVATQMSELEGLSRLRRFLAPQVASLVAQGDRADRMLESHRSEVTVVFCDLRGFTAFTDTGEPEDVMSVLHAYHATVGDLVDRHEGALERFAGDGIMIMFNDPVPCPDHPLRAVRMALDIRDSVGALTRTWSNRGYQLGFGIGIAVGYATLGQIGFERRREYAAIGSVTNLASRLCDEARSGQIVVSRALYGRVEADVEAAFLGDLTLKGFNRSIAAYNVDGLRSGTVFAAGDAASHEASTSGERG
jgi:class 3 adenylate cyclase/CheY-like chemotaxis protein